MGVLAVKTATGQVASRARMMELCKSESDLYGSRLQDLNETIAIVERLINGSRASVSFQADGCAVDDASSATALSDTQDGAMPMEADACELAADMDAASDGNLEHQFSVGDKTGSSHERWPPTPQRMRQRAATPMSPSSPIDP